MFYGASHCGFAERIVRKKEIIERLSGAIDERDANGQRVLAVGETFKKGKGTPNNRTLANLTMIRAFVNFTFADDAYFLFQRNWQVRDNKEKFVATWSFGWFLTHIGMA